MIGNDLTKGNVTKTLVTFAFPLFLSNMLQAIYNIVDMVVVGQVMGMNGMSAVSIGGDVLHLLSFVAMGFSNAGQVIISQFVGAGLMDKVRKLIGTLFTFLLIVSISLSIICFIGRDALLGFLNTPESSYKDAMDYTICCLVGLVFIYGYNVVSAILRGMGDSKRPFIFISIAAVLNTILDIIFVAFWNMGTFGAALATVIGQAVSFITSIVYLAKHKEQFGFDFKLSSFVMDGQVFEPLLKLGIPMTIQSAAVQFSKMYVVRWVNSFGVEYSAMNGAANKLKTISMLGSNAFNTAASATIGQCIGAEKYDRVPKVLKSTVSICSVIAVLMSAVMLAAPEFVVGMFTTDSSVLVLASVFAPIAVIEFFGSATRAFGFSLINGSGFSKLNLCVALVDGLIARLSLAYLLGFTFNLGCFGVWLGDALAGHVPGVIGSIYFLSKKWMTRKYLIEKMKIKEK